MRYPTLTKGLIARIRKGNIVGQLNFQFNPTTVNRSGAVEYNWGAGPGSVLPVATFSKMGEMSISLELFFDARENFDKSKEGLRAVLAEAESIGLPALEKWSAQRGALAVAPDRCCLVLGKRHWYCECVNWAINEEMWNEELDPVRAKVSYTLRMVNTGLLGIQKYVDTLKQYRNKYEGKPSPNKPVGNATGGGGVGDGGGGNSNWVNPYK